MCAAAEASVYYSRVVAGELISVLASAETPFGLAIACDTVIYLGDLDPLFNALERAVSPRGWFVFSTEKSDGMSEEAIGRGYEIGPSRRFRHTEVYLRALAGKHGFDLRFLDTAVLRMEKRQPVESFVCVMQRR